MVIFTVPYYCAKQGLLMSWLRDGYKAIYTCQNSSNFTFKTSDLNKTYISKELLKITVIKKKEYFP